MSSNALIRVANKVIFSVFLWFCFWTVGSNVITFAGLTSGFLPLNLALSTTLLFIFLVRYSAWLPNLHAKVGRNTLSFYSYKDLPLRKLALLLFLGALISLLVYKYHIPWIYFLGGMVVLAVGFYCFLEPVDTLHEHGDKGDIRLVAFELLFLMLGLCLLYYFGHQIDTDDANYVNLGLGAFRTEGGVFELDTMVGKDGLPIHLPTYKAHSFELLTGTLAYVFPGSALLFAHVLIPIFSCVLFALTLFVINYFMFEKQWFVAAIFQLTFTILCIDSIPSLGAHGFFRFFQGKVVFINIVIPLCIMQVIKWNAGGEKRDLLFLFLLVISSVGLTANAIYIAPIAIGLAALPFLFFKPIDKNNIVRLSMTLSPILYPALIAMAIIINGVYPSEVLVETNQVQALFTYFGWNAWGLICIVLLPAIPFFVIKNMHAKYLFIYIAAIFIFLFNPLFWPTFSSISGNLPARIFWAIPFFLLFAIPFVAIVRGLERWFNCSVIKYSFVVLLLLASALVLHFQSLNKDRPINIDWHAKPYRVNYKDFEVAKFIAEEFSPNCRAVLPKNIAHHVPMIEGYPYPVAVRNLYLEHYRHTMEKGEVRLRWELMNSVSEEATFLIGYENIMRGFEMFDIDMLLIKKDNLNFHTYQKAKTSFKLNNEQVVGDYVLYYKTCS